MSDGAVIMPAVSAVRLFNLPHHTRDGGEVIVAEATHVPFAIVRLFTVRAPVGSVRGQHAHRRCTQLMICANGALRIECDDGANKKAFALDRSNKALHVPPTIWASIVFEEPASVLNVLCDRPYEEQDYVRAYPEFIAMRNGSPG